MIENRLSELKKQKFITEAEEELTPKSFLDKHYKTLTPTKFFSYLFSGVSVAFGCVAIYSTLLESIGVKTSLIESFEEVGLVAGFLVLLAGLLLLFFEAGKHHFYKVGFLDYYRAAEGFGFREISFAVFLQVISIFLSAYGGFLIAGEITGIEKSKKLTAIDSEFKPLIAEAKNALTDYKETKTWRGKISDKNTPELNRLQQNLDVLKSQYLEAKKGGGVLGFVTTDARGTQKMIFIFTGSQVLIEIFLTFCLWWVIYVKSRAVYEANILTNQLPRHFKKGTELKTVNLESPLVATLSPQREIGFKRTHKPDPQNRIKGHTNPETVVPQRSQQNPQKTQPDPQPLVVDLSPQKKRVRTYMKRIEKGFTQTLFDRIRKDVSVLANFGYKVTPDDGKVKIENTIPRGSQCEVKFVEGQVKIDYL